VAVEDLNRSKIFSETDASVKVPPCLISYSTWMYAVKIQSMNVLFFSVVS